MKQVESETPLVSIVIVCMNKPENLKACLGSIRKYTKIPYETFVVAYLFSEKNLMDVKRDYPWVSFIESNEIRGFSENNNLALRQARGKYCFVLNDDTEMKTSVIDHLVHSIERLPNNVAAISPRSVYGDGTLQTCGRAVNTTWTYILWRFKLWNESSYIQSKANETGLFETGDLLGALFLIKTDIFREIGFFDEKYFFTPEDLAVGHELRKKGYKCYADAGTEIIHYEGMSGGKSISMVKTATSAAATRGLLIYFSHGNALLYILLSFITILSLLPKIVYYYTLSLQSLRPNKGYVYYLSCKHALKACVSRRTPKELFCHYFQQLSTK